MKVRVYHGSYGCDTGCCGHYVEIDDRHRSRIDFGHGATRENARQYAEDIIRERWPECLASIGWTTMEVDIPERENC